MKTPASCPVCSGTTYLPYLVCTDYTVSKKEFQIQQCKDCGFLMTAPRPEDADLGQYYKSDTYISHSDTSEGWINKVYKLARRFTLSRKYALVKPYAGRLGLLDVGCGTGAFLNYCQEQDVHVQGVEPDPDARASVERMYHLRVSDESALDAWEEGSFSAITLWHVLEHVPELNTRIEQLKRLLDKEGRLFVAVPNPDSGDAQYYKAGWAAYDVPRHLWHFTPKTIRALFNKHGFVLERTLPMPLDAFYVSLLSEQYRKGSTLNAFWRGLRSNLAAGGDKWSSQIYVFKK
jgi:SAM-dependent methyltransferase